MSAIFHNTVAETGLRSGIDRLLNLLWKGLGDRAAVRQPKIDPPEPGILLDSQTSCDGWTEAELIFCSMMWLGM